LISQHTIGIPE